MWISIVYYERIWAWIMKFYVLNVVELWEICGDLIWSRSKPICTYWKNIMLWKFYWSKKGLSLLLSTLWITRGTPFTFWEFFGRNLHYLKKNKHWFWTCGSCSSNISIIPKLGIINSLFYRFLWQVVSLNFFVS
jgi:hypothetical protein